MKKYLFVMRTQPHGSHFVLEMLDVILTIAAFDQKVSLLFVDKGVFQLKTGQNPSHLEMKDTAAIFKALEIYDVHDVFAEVESLQAAGLKPSDLILPVEEVYRKDINRLMRDNDIIMGV